MPVLPFLEDLALLDISIPFFNFSNSLVPPSPGEVINIYSPPPSKQKGGSELCTYKHFFVTLSFWSKKKAQQKKQAVTDIQSFFFKGMFLL